MKDKTYKMTKEAESIPAQIIIMEKSTGKIIDRATARFDEAQKKARTMVSGREDKLKWKVVTVVK